MTLVKTVIQTQTRSATFASTSNARHAEANSVRLLFAAIALLVMPFASIPANAQTTLNFLTGTAPVGQPDPVFQVRGFWYRTPTDPRPTIVIPNHPLQPAIVGNTLGGIWDNPPPGGRWIGPSLSSGIPSGAPGGYEYFVEFNLPANVSSISLLATGNSDDTCYINVNGIYLYQEQSYLRAGVFSRTFDLLELVQHGVNRLSFMVENAQAGNPNPTGLAMSATITYNVSAAPEPGTLGLAFPILVGGWIVRRQRPG